MVVEECRSLDFRVYLVLFICKPLYGSNSPVHAKVSIKVTLLLL